jgi:peptidoglycan LD-endopeptidase CwlK
MDAALHPMLMDLKSEAFLARVHPDLARVMRTAAQTPQPFVIVYGLRTLAAEEAAVAAGRSTTLHSRHLANAQGVACAVDVAALADGEPNWAPGREQEVFGRICDQVQAACDVTGVQLEWGGDWDTFKDFGHFQLPWLGYP